MRGRASPARWSVVENHRSVLIPRRAPGGSAWSDRGSARKLTRDRCRRSWDHRRLQPSRHALSCLCKRLCRLGCREFLPCSRRRLKVTPVPRRLDTHAPAPKLAVSISHSPVRISNFRFEISERAASPLLQEIFSLGCLKIARRVAATQQGPVEVAGKRHPEGPQAPKDLRSWNELLRSFAQETGLRRTRFTRLGAIRPERGRACLSTKMQRPTHGRQGRIDGHTGMQHVGET